MNTSYTLDLAHSHQRRLAADLAAHRTRRLRKLRPRLSRLALE